MDVNKTLRTAFDEILDKMAFLFFEDWEDEEPPPAHHEFDFSTGITFKGAITGTLQMLFTTGSAEELARNLLGIRPDDELFKGTMEDALLEFTNMVMGRTLTLLNPDKSFEMTVPFMAGEPPAPASGEESFQIDGMLEDEPCRVLLRYRVTG